MICVLLYVPGLHTALQILKYQTPEYIFYIYSIFLKEYDKTYSSFAFNYELHLQLCVPVNYFWSPIIKPRQCFHLALPSFSLFLSGGWIFSIVAKFIISIHDSMTNSTIIWFKRTFIIIHPVTAMAFESGLYKRHLK